MTLDKRTIISSKRARNKRKKAQRSLAKSQTALLLSDEGGEAPTDGSSGDEAASKSSATGRAGATTSAEPRRVENQCESEDEAEDDGYDEDQDEIVFVCQPSMQDFCTEFVATAGAYTVVGAGASGDKVAAWADLRKFTVCIPAFRETRDGYTTYSIVVTTTGDWRKQFQLERRYSEFVAFAGALDEYFQSSHYQQLREKLGRTSQANQEAGGACQPTSFRWDLPPKTWFRVTQATALEERRSKLEASLQSLLAHDPQAICLAPVVRDFLMLDIFGSQVVEEKLQRV